MERNRNSKLLKEMLCFKTMTFKVTQCVRLNPIKARNKEYFKAIELTTALFSHVTNCTMPETNHATRGEKYAITLSH